MTKKILCPLPSHDFDPTEVAIPWKILTEAKFEMIFATPFGKVATCDDRMISGRGLGIWSSLLRADQRAREAYEIMSRSPEFRNPISWAAIDSRKFQGLLLPGGHAPGMKEYLESHVLQNKVVEFFHDQKVVGAICHGTVLAARSRDPSGRSVLYGRKSTALLKSQEMSAWAMTALWLANYYRTYPETVEAEIRRNLKKEEDFQKGPTPFLRDSPDNLNRGFVVQDQNYVSARWPGDAHTFANKLVELLTEQKTNSI
jgi:protease I